MSTLTTIGIIGFIATIIAGLISYVVYALVKTPAGRFTVTGDFGGKPLNILEPGLNILWGKPYYKVLLQPQLQLVNGELPSFPLTCLIEDLPADKPFDLDTHGNVELTSGNVSFSYKLKKPAKNEVPETAKATELELFFEQFQLTPYDKAKAPKTENERKRFAERFPMAKDGDEFLLDHSQVRERLRDLIRETIKNDTARLGILAATSSPVQLAEHARKVVGMHTAGKTGHEEQLMIELCSLNIDAPFAPKNQAMRDELDKKALAKVELSAATEQMARKELEAARGVVIARSEAEAKATRITTVLAAYGKNLTEHERVRLLMTQEALHALEIMGASGGSKVIVSGNLLTEAEGIISRIMGGGKP